MRLDGRDFLSLADLSAEELTHLLDLADRLKAGEQSKALEGRSVALLFEHPSLRTRLSDREHPCQALADLQTMRERLGSLKGAVLLYCGDGNNVCHSLLLAGAKMGMSVWVATPPAFEPRTEIVTLARREAEKTGASIRVDRNPDVLVNEADALYTDVWASMGQETEKEQRRRIFSPYQINERLLSRAKPGALVMHCLPAHRGEEITDEVIDGAQSVVFDQAENRLHAQKALLSMLL